MSVELLQPEVVIAALPFLKVYFAPVVDSTQDCLNAMIKDDRSPALVFTENQTRGRGRAQKKWHAEVGSSLCFSMHYVFNQPAHELSGLTLALGVSLLEVFSSWGVEGLFLKWPNDIYLNDQKLSGILTEVFTQADGSTSAVIGVGINVLPPADFENAVAALQTAVAKPISRTALLIDCVRGLYSACDRYAQTGLSSFLPMWDRYDYLKGRLLTLKQGDRIFQAHALGVSEAGALKIDQAPFECFSIEIM